MIGIDDVRDVRKLVETLHHRFVHNLDDVSRVAMATHELLENAVKFSVDGKTKLRIELVSSGRIRITTRNRALPANVEELTNLAQEFRDAIDPMLLYVDLMRRTPIDKLGGLGLGRVAAEGEMTIGLDLDGDFVQVFAEATLAEPAA